MLASLSAMCVSDLLSFHGVVAHFSVATNNDILLSGWTTVCLFTY